METALVDLSRHVCFERTLPEALTGFMLGAVLCLDASVEDVLRDGGTFWPDAVRAKHRG
jgi:hypothetical protein